MKIIPLEKVHFPSVLKIYTEGIKTGIATFETEVPSWEQWNKKMLPQCRFVVIKDEKIAGWCSLSAVSQREVYRGVAENTIYVSAESRGTGIGKKLLQHLLIESEKAGFWTIQASIFRQNKASIQLHKNCGFRIVGIREKIAQRDGVWHDNLLMERRSNKIILQETEKDL